MKRIMIKKSEYQTKQLPGKHPLAVSNWGPTQCAAFSYLLLGQFTVVRNAVLRLQWTLSERLFDTKKDDMFVRKRQAVDHHTTCSRANWVIGSLCTLSPVYLRRTCNHARVTLPWRHPCRQSNGILLKVHTWPSWPSHQTQCPWSRHRSFHPPFRRRALQALPLWKCAPGLVGEEV